jgi:xanthine dehydrogenase accessory factor
VVGAVLVLGAGDVGSAVAHALLGAGHRVALADVPLPAVLRRGMAFADALAEGEAQLAGITAWRSDDLGAIARAMDRKPAGIAITALPLADLAGMPWGVVVDARMRKHSGPAPVEMGAAPVIGLGPGFVAGGNCAIGVETSWEAPGRVIREGPTLRQAGEPRALGGARRERLAAAAGDGVFTTKRRIGEAVQAGEVVGELSGTRLAAPLAGVLRGLVRDGVPVKRGTKLFEVDPRGDRAACFGLGERPAAVAAGVVQAVTLLRALARAV